MRQKSLAAVAALAATVVIAIPALAFGSARRCPSGSLSFIKDSQTPYVAS